MSETPERIWLQKPLHENNWNESTWCEEKVEHDDIEYVRADRLTALEAENKALRESLTALLNLDQRCGWHSKEADAALALLAKGDGK